MKENTNSIIKRIIKSFSEESWKLSVAQIVYDKLKVNKMLQPLFFCDVQIIQDLSNTDWENNMNCALNSRPGAANQTHLITWSSPNATKFKFSETETQPTGHTHCQARWWRADDLGWFCNDRCFQSLSCSWTPLSIAEWNVRPSVQQLKLCPNWVM